MLRGAVKGRFGLFGIVMTAGGILESAGMAFPMGKPLLKAAS